MPRPRERVSLQAGLSLNLAVLQRQRLATPGCKVGPRSIRRSYVETDETIAEGLEPVAIKADCIRNDGGSWRILQG
jgi:hypothetical protein